MFFVNSLIIKLQAGVKLEKDTLHYHILEN